MDVNNLCGWGMSQTLSVKSFRCVENTSQFNEEFLENYCEDSNEE